MKLIEILRKLGVLRSGVVGGTYKNAKDMPDELMYDNVYDKKKDLVGGKKQEKSSKPSNGKPWLFWILLVVSGLSVFSLELIMGFGIWFFVCLMVWLIFIFLLFRYKNGLSTTGVIVISFSITLFVSIIIIYAWLPNGLPNMYKNNETNSTESKPSQNLATQTPDCKTLAERYDSKVWTVSSTDALKGEIGFKIDKNTCTYEFTWHTIFTSPNITKNVSNALSPIASYDYVADIVFANESSHPADGNIDPVFANKDKLPEDPFNIRVPYTYYSTKEVIANTDKSASTQTFHHVMQSKGILSQSTFDNILSVKKITIYPRDTGVTGTPVAEYQVSILEK